MRSTAIFFAGVMLVSAAFARASDPMAEERYRTKYGRYTPVEETRRAARSQTTQDAAGACCRTMHGASATTATTGDASGQEARFAAKHGRMALQAEARQRTRGAEVAAHVKKCVEVGQCSRKHGSAEPVASGTSVPNDTELRLRAKYGATVPSQARRPTKNQERELVASAETGGCEHECCKHGD